MTDKELYDLIKEDYDKTIEEISKISGLSVDEVDDFIQQTMDDFFEGNTEELLEILENGGNI